jgi:hypothetical protein
LIGAVVLSTTDITDHNAANKLKLGKDLAMAGVILQIVTFGLFSIVAVRFHFTSTRFTDEFKQRYQAQPGDKYVSAQGSAQKYDPNWRRLLYAVNISCLMILVCFPFGCPFAQTDD